MDVNITHTKALLMKDPTPENITELKPDEVFVFGSNEAGIHGAGAAKTALEKFGAIYGVGYGFEGQSFAIPTKDSSLETLPLLHININVASFLLCANSLKHKTFLVTKIGCGLAGLTPEQIAPMFRLASDNVRLPKEFLEILNKQ